jgi:hypothetical protein
MKRTELNVFIDRATACSLQSSVELGVRVERDDTGKARRWASETQRLLVIYNKTM